MKTAQTELVIQVIEHGLPSGEPVDYLVMSMARDIAYNDLKLNRINDEWMYSEIAEIMTDERNNYLFDITKAYKNI